MFTVIIFFIVIGVLVLVHEWGHFIMAKRAGMKVEEFGFGFPPRIFGYKKGETLYSFNAIPFGGFVKILGEDGGHRDNPRSFGSKGFWARFSTIAAGVVMNFILAVVLLIFANFFGLRIGIFDAEMEAMSKDKKVQIISVAPESPAQKAGMTVLDEIVGFIDANKEISIRNTEEVSNFTNSRKGQNVDVIIRRGTEEIILQDVPVRENPPAGEGALGISMVLTGVVTYPWYEAIWRGAYSAVILLMNTIYGYYMLLSSLFTEGKLIADVSGPVGIANITGQAARTGFSYLMQFVALISVNLAVLNAIPFPALDGGRLLMLVIEKIKGSPIKKEIEGAINTVGFALLILLMVYVTFKDISKFF